MRRVLLLALLIAAVWPAAANATVPCRNKIYNDWYPDGKIKTTYPISCYRDALKHVHNDAKIYSSLVDDIKSAMQGALERQQGDKKVPAEIGRGLESAGTSTGSVKGTEVTLHSQKKPSTNEKKRHTETVAVGATTTSNGNGIPTPIIVLGALALLLAAIGAAGTGYRRYQHRRR